MFENMNFKEESSGILEINDFDFSTVRNMIGFIYKDQFTDFLFYHELIELYKIGDKYDLKILAGKCIEELILQIETASLLEICQFYKVYDGETELREEIVKFISKNLDSIVKKDYWNEIKISFGNIVIDSLALKFDYKM